uniref:Uncharacterized protein n=1 Tax=Candidatus Kentrum eta TaxID=2126337 RepID=A0A450VJI6_9GAMM|nr:MAG: hypothetical protein BECKH772A_GA0070896_102126 [Candidatus Kentron sp. H]VFK01089.1 MAG: hypothetical protein BECKH772B_GA0070898_102176 [Candidatus Kentron sp. H]VFK04900.1 MAG: hypothetical protein BECKH772C_GA0070978_102186 [Candidatus Kentron sp. H]
MRFLVSPTFPYEENEKPRSRRYYIKAIARGGRKFGGIGKETDCLHGVFEVLGFLINLSCGTFKIPGRLFKPLSCILQRFPQTVGIFKFRGFNFEVQRSMKFWF